MRRLAVVLILGVGLLAGTRAAAVTWSEGTSECPVCKKTIPVQRVASYGSYVYRYPSRFQLVFWPHTDSRAWYFCPHCHYSAFMGDFATLPADKVAAVRAAIAKVKQPQPAKAYYDVPLVYRLKVAAAIATALGRDDVFWCHFARVHGYHLAQAGDAKGAKAAREGSLVLAARLLKANVPEPSKKELMFVIGSMQHFTGQDKAALASLAAVAKTPVEPKGKMSEERRKSFGQYLDELAKSLADMIEKGEKVPE